MTMMDDDNDLDDMSPYERKRLERIRRNELRLKELGLIKLKPKITTISSPISVIKKMSRKRNPPLKKLPTRSSKRIRQLNENKIEDDDENSTKIEELTEEETAEEEGTLIVDYNRWPQAPEELDDDEFEIFINLRKWRMVRKNELEVEPYKICQNRTICELIRRKRNDAKWADSSKEEYTSDILECWGIGPSKVAEDGFGPEMIRIIE
eukprot:CAMPEP_0194178112 /NCGR_PEP_ID=MMETSP0154-20130528/11781_1 /TAXON_ID=1049557 /ORGANISM="Thalassiothrix antarctica, Strain L6-D1" /LENGTH=207 /DNA_ID=CAMNT_0038892947 /DNA_START=19 /DNA_END=639 /DNA_ORIENTATION=-